MTLTFRVYGIPAPQGSKRHVGNGVMVESSKKVRPWREAVIAAAREAHQGPPMDGAVSLVVEFVMPRPKSARKAATWQTSYPDVDKLLRSTFDALKVAGVLRDDARVAHVVATKLLANLDDPWTGADVQLGAIANGERAA